MFQDLTHVHSEGQFYDRKADSACLLVTDSLCAESVAQIYIQTPKSLAYSTSSQGGNVCVQVILIATKAKNLPVSTD